MITLKRLVTRGSNLVAAIAVVGASLAPVLFPGSAYAASSMGSRSLTQSSTAPGTQANDAYGVALAALAGTNGAKTSNLYTFTVSNTATAIGSIAFQYCTTPLFGTTCTTPTGLNTAGITTIASTTNSGTANWTIDTTTAGNTGSFATQQCTGGGAVKRDNCILIKRSAAASVVAAGTTFTFGVSGTNIITNPTSAGAFYVRITTFGDQTFGTSVDEGAVAGSVTPTIDITAKVQEMLNFSVSGTHSAPGTGCTALSGSGAVQINSAGNGILDTLNGYDAYSWLRLNTNAANGTAVYYSGDTLKKSDGTAITALSALTASTVGTEQFGLDVDSGGTGYTSAQLTSATGASGQNYGAAGFIATGTLVSGTPKFILKTASLTTPEKFLSATGTVTCDTIPMRYLANIATTTKPGLFSTSIGYIAVPTF